MTSLIMPFSEDEARDILTGREKMIIWGRNFKSKPERIVVSVLTENGAKCIGTVRVKAKAFVTTYKALCSLEKFGEVDYWEYWKRYSKFKKVCIIYIDTPRMFFDPVSMPEFLGAQAVGSGVYYNGELPDVRDVEDLDEIIENAKHLEGFTRHQTGMKKAFILPQRTVGRMLVIKFASGMRSNQIANGCIHMMHLILSDDQFYDSLLNEYPEINEELEAALNEPRSMKKMFRMDESVFEELTELSERMENNFSKALITSIETLYLSMKRQDIGQRIVERFPEAGRMICAR